MELTTAAYLTLLGLVGAGRLLEVGVSSRNRRRMAARGVASVSDPAFGPMVLVHTGVLVGAALEVTLLHRVFVPALAVAMGSLFLASTALRLWVRRTLGMHWNVRVMASAPLGVVTSGPYRFIRHPNYVAVFVELLALPLIHTAWLTAGISAPAHLLVLRRRIAVEEEALARDESYQTVMGAKPRFFPLPSVSSPARGPDRRSRLRSRSGSSRSRGDTR